MKNINKELNIIINLDRLDAVFIKKTAINYLFKSGEFVVTNCITEEKCKE